jgi:hypothetical protein
MLYTPRPRASAAVLSSRSRRAAAPSCRGGASSLLRLAQPSAPRLPSTQSLGDWVQRAMNVLLPPKPGFEPTEFTPG